MTDLIKTSRLIPLLLLLITICCTKDNLPSQDPNFSFSPLAIGQFAEYNVERTKYSITSPPKVQYFTTRKVITDSLRDINNQLVYKTEHYHLDEKSVWKSDSNSISWQTLDKSIDKENGQTIVQMIYPLSNELTWNGNLYNSIGEAMFKVTDLGKSYISQSERFPNTVRIIRQDDSTLLSKNSYIEIYAQNVGLVRKEKVFIKYCNTPDCLGKAIINSGWKEISTIKNYGK